MKSCQQLHLDSDVFVKAFKDQHVADKAFRFRCFHYLIQHAGLCDVQAAVLPAATAAVPLQASQCWAAYPHTALMPAKWRWEKQHVWLARYIVSNRAFDRASMLRPRHCNMHVTVHCPPATWLDLSSPLLKCTGCLCPLQLQWPVSQIHLPVKCCRCCFTLCPHSVFKTCPCMLTGCTRMPTAKPFPLL